MATKQIVNDILSDLTSVKENLLTLSEDIWNNIDHNDTDKLEEGVQFKKEFNKVFKDFNGVSEQLSVLIRQFTGINENSKIQVITDSENRRLIEELNKEIKHSISEDFTYKRPFAFILCEKAFRNTTTWKDVYVLFLKSIYKNDVQKFESFLTNEEFCSKKAKKCFSKVEKELRVPAFISNGIYAETNYSANSITRNICKIIKECGLKESDISIYLRQDRNA